MTESSQGHLFIGGVRAAGEERFEVRDPGRFTDVVATVGLGSVAHVDGAVEAARGAERHWRRTSVDERIAVLEAAILAVEGRTDGLAFLLSRENGGTLRESTMDLQRGIALFRDLLDRAARFLAPEITDTAQHWLAIEKTPVGVTSLIVPWNSPIVLTMSKLAPALVAGNTVVVKPSVYAPLALTDVLITLAELLPPGVLNVVQGDAEVGGALVAHTGVRKVAFTGSTRVGKQVMSGATGTLKNVSLELGGNDAAIVLPDLDFDAALPQLCSGVFTRAGQICFAVKRVYVPRSRYEEFFDAMCAVVDTYQVGYQLDEGTTFGPLINAREHARVRSLIERAVSEGATVCQLGRQADQVDWDSGYYLLPTVVRDVDADAELVSTEQFGPVVPLVPYGSEDEVIDYANDSEFGLCSSVWSADVEHAIAVARQLEAGGTFINSHNLASLSFDMPFGGVKQSGIGRERTDLGLREYVEEHAIRFVK